MRKTDDVPRQVAWTTEEESALAKGGGDKARAAAKNKGSKALRSSTMNDDALARLVVNEMSTAEVEQREAFIELKRREPYDHFTEEQRLAWDEIRAKIKAKYNLQF
nr:hypothetical protein [Tanacetum cinerariifolium]